jgi:hypothetical protein
MFKNYSEFLNESLDEDLSLAKKLASDSELKPILDNCLEGIHSHISVVETHDARSYVAIALNDGAPISEAYKVEDPRIALVAIMIKNTGRKTAEEIKSLIETHDPILAYSVFAGDEKMSRDEILSRYNFTKPEMTVPYFTSTPVYKLS